MKKTYIFLDEETGLVTFVGAESEEEAMEIAMKRKENLDKALKQFSTE